MTIDGCYLYVAELSGGVEVFDISHPFAPRRVGGSSRYIVTSVAAAAQRLYFATQGDGFIPAYTFKSASINEFSRTNSFSIFKVQGPPNVDAILEFTSDFVQWVDGATVTFREGPSELSQPSTDAQEFYRLTVR